jgi:YceI-like domain
MLIDQGLRFCVKTVNWELYLATVLMASAVPGAEKADLMATANEACNTKHAARGGRLARTAARIPVRRCILTERGCPRLTPPTRSRHVLNAAHLSLTLAPPENGSGSKGVLNGDLTIHGVTRNVSLATKFNGTSVDPGGNLRGSFTASTELSRKDFGLTMTGVKETGGLLLGDKIKVSLDIEAIKAA